jgi:hypothetical protein
MSKVNDKEQNPGLKYIKEKLVCYIKNGIIYFVNEYEGFDKPGKYIRNEVEYLLIDKKDITF